jgi:hypothetical protein
MSDARIQPISQDTEDRIYDVVRSVIAEVGENEDPTDCLVKFACDAGLTPHQVVLASRAYNVAKSESQRKNSGKLFDKVAAFLPVNPDAAVEAMFPDQLPAPSVKVAFDELQVFDPDSSPVRVKTASAILSDPKEAQGRDPGFKTLREMSHVKRAQRVVEQLEDEAETRYLDLRGLLEKLAAALSRSRYTCRSVRANCEKLFGKAGTELFDLIGRQMPNEIRQEKVASDIVDLKQEPYRSVAACLLAAKSCSEFVDKIAQAKEKLNAAKKEYDRLFPANDKTAGVLSGLGGELVGSSLAGSVRQKLLMDTDPEAAKSRAETALEDPAQSARVRDARATAMLNRLISDDPIISRSEPDKVMQHFNDMASLAPSAVNDESIVRSELRRRLEGGDAADSPAQLGQLLDLDRSVANRSNEMGVLANRSVLN